MFSQTVEYALRAVIYLADHSPIGRTTQQIADVTKVPQAYLSKVLQSLSKNGVVRSQRGIGGGISLIKKPEELTILEVVNAVDPIQRIHTCPLGIKSHGETLCPLHRRIDESIATMEAAFQNSTLADILSEPSKSIPLCSSDEPGIVDLNLDCSTSTKVCESNDSSSD